MKPDLPQDEWERLLSTVSFDLSAKDQLSDQSKEDARQLQKGTRDFSVGNTTPAAVLVPVVNSQDRAQIVLTRRSEQLSSHKGQVAFPGGKIDPTDGTASAAAIRETCEEIGIPSHQISVIGKLPLYETGTGFIITPIVASVSPPYLFKKEEGEVEEIFQVPLSHVANLAHYHKQSVYWQGVERHFWVLDYEDYFIWGATAAILNDLARRLNNTF